MGGPVIVHALGSAFIGRVAKRNAVRISRLERELLDSEQAVMAGLERMSDLHTETLRVVNERDARFAEFIDRLEGVSDAFAASLKELRQEL